jgi:hypothetical protein
MNDKELEKELRDSNSIFDWNPRMTEEKRPLQYEWIPVGEYDGVDLPDIYIDEDYIIWQLVECPEYNCEIS